LALADARSAAAGGSSGDCGWKVVARHVAYRTEGLSAARRGGGCTARQVYPHIAAGTGKTRIMKPTWRPGRWLIICHAISCSYSSSFRSPSLQISFAEARARAPSRTISFTAIPSAVSLTSDYRYLLQDEVYGVATSTPCAPLFSHLSACCSASDGHASRRSPRSPRGCCCHHHAAVLDLLPVACLCPEGSSATTLSNTALLHWASSVIRCA